MTENSSPSHFKAEMPQIPGVNAPSPKSPRRNPLLPLMIGFVALAVLLLIGGRWLSRSRPVEPERVAPTPQIEIPAPPPDPNAALPHANSSNPAIADISALAKPWSSADFFVRNNLTGEDIPATIVRLPGGNPSQPSSYWAFSRNAPYGSCKLEYLTDLEKIRQEYDYKAAKHPLVGNPCSRTLFDPLRTGSLPGNTWVRGAIVQGSEIRPPFGVEIQISGKQILAIRTE